MALTFLLGGARSGKSSLAVKLGAEHGGPVAYIATCPRIDGDDDLDSRIDRHRADRPDWPTIEEPYDLRAALGRCDGDALVIVDCVSLWVSNLVFRGDRADAIITAADVFAVDASQRGAPTVVVSNEVGMGVHPETPLGREYRDILGSVNQVIAAHASPALMMIAGRAIELRRPGDFLA